MNSDKTMVAKGFGGKNFPILNKGNQVARCEGEIGVPNRGPRAVKGWSQSWNIAMMQIVGESNALVMESLLYDESTPNNINCGLRRTGLDIEKLAKSALLESSWLSLLTSSSVVKQIAIPSIITSSSHEATTVPTRREPDVH
ncbi:hypothetical protein TNCV_718441 [Trichonephila clavipes]|nr:hypothetical protein TNCV_718441 [Trichonephila clavipes]